MWRAARAGCAAMMRVVRVAARAAIAVLLGVRCAGCSRPTPAARAICARCVAQLYRARADGVQPFAGGDGAMFVDHGVVARIVRGAKSGHARAAARELVAAAQLSCAPDTIVTWVPAEPRRRRKRGAHLPELLARELARQHGLACVDLLTRGAGPPQRGRSRAARQVATLGVFRARRDADLTLARLLCVSAHDCATANAPSRPATLLIVDDVRTTGATLAACEGELRVVAGKVAAYGVSAPMIVTIAATRVPLHSEHRSIRRVATNLRP